jgi:NAD(P)-dependent dehydrogenase (short-subunit alcohol dehydrogenase family)
MHRPRQRAPRLSPSSLVVRAPCGFRRGKISVDKKAVEGKTALVTGAGQGIGRAFARALGEAGARVAIVDIDAARAEKAAQELARDGIVSVPFETDVTSEAAVTRMVNAIVAKWGDLTIAFNNAGIGAWHDSVL